MRKTMKKWRKYLRRPMAVLLVLVMTLGTLQMTAFAADEGTEGQGNTQTNVSTSVSMGKDGSMTTTQTTTETTTEKSEDEDGNPVTTTTVTEETRDESGKTTSTTTTTTTTTTKESTDAAGNTTTTTETKVEKYTTDKDGNTTHSEEESTESRTTDREGKPVNGSGSTAGSEKDINTEVEENPQEPGEVQEKDKHTDVLKEEEQGPYELPEDSQVDKDQLPTPEAKDDDVTVTLRPGESDTKYSGVKDMNETLEKLKQTLKEQCGIEGDEDTVTTETTDTQTVTDSTGKQTTIEEKTTTTKKVEPIEDETGLVGYKVVTETTVTTTTTDKTRGETETDPGKAEPVEGAKPVVTEEIVLPEKPAAQETKGEDGVTTRVTVEELRDEKGRIVGYRTTTTRTDARGNVLSSENESLWGTKTVTTTYPLYR